MIKYNFSESIFQTIDSPEKAYWLGFLYADGYNSYKGIVSLCLNEEDVDHLEKFKKILNAKDIKLQKKKKLNALNPISFKF